MNKYYYPDKPEEVRALYNVSVEIRRGQLTLVRGPSGAGKTTLISILGAIDRPSSGRVFLNGEEITRFSDLALSQIRRYRVGFVFQGFNLIPRLSAWETVTLPLVPFCPSEKERYQRAVELLRRFGLEKRAKHTPEELSGGEQQRVAIARAFVCNPEILIADEPTSNIDKRSIDNLLNVLLNSKKEGRTVIVSSHDPIFLDCADLTLELEEGKLVDVRRKEA